MLALSEWLKCLYRGKIKFVYVFFYGLEQDWEEIPSSCLGQVDFATMKVSFHSHLPNGKVPLQVVLQLNKKIP